MLREDLDRWLTHGLSPHTRVLYLGGTETDEIDAEISWTTTWRLIRGLHYLEATGTSGKKPITVIMNSPGGDWSMGMAIYDAIKHCKNHVTIINMSHASSMTSIIFQAADYRITSPNGYYLIHDGSKGLEDTARTVISSAEYERDHVLPTMYKVYLDRILERDEAGKPKVDFARAAEIINSKLPHGAEKVNPRRPVKLNHIAQLCTRDTFFTPEEMIHLNLADRLLETGDLIGAYANPDLHGRPVGAESLLPNDE